MMDGNAIEQLKGWAEEANRHEVLHEDYRSKTLMLPGSMEPFEIQKALPDRSHVVCDLESMRQFIEGLTAATIWVGETKIICVLDDGENSYRRDTVTLNVQPSPLFKAIPGENHWEPSTFRRKLLHDIKPNATKFDGLTDLLLAVSSVKFESGQSTEAKVSKTVDHMGASIRREATGADKLPDSFSFEFHGYPQFPELAEHDYQPCRLSYSLHADPQLGHFVVSPIMGSIDAAKRVALLSLKNLVCDSMPGDMQGRIFTGSP